MKHVWWVFALALAGCKPSSVPPKPLGEPLVRGQLSNIQLLPGGTHVRFLADARSPQTQETASLLKLGKLYLFNLKTRQQTEVGKQVANFMEAQHATADGEYLVFLDAFNVKTKTGSLRCVEVARAVVGEALGEDVSFFVVSPQTRQLAFVEGGILKVGELPQGPFKAIAEGVVNLEFSQDGTMLAFKKRLEENGQLWVVDLQGVEERKPRLVAAHTGNYRLSKDGNKLAFTAKEAPKEVAYRLFFADTRKESAPKQLSQEMFRFLLSPDERWLAYIETKTPEKPGMLWIKPLEEKGGEAQMLGDRVMDFGFASTGEALAWREAYYGNEGLLAVVQLKGGDLEPQRLTPRTRHWQWNAQGQALAYTAMVSNPEVSVDLFSFRLGDKAPTKVHAWVYEYAFSTDGEKLLFEANCTREGRSCELLSTRLQEGEVALKEKLAEGVYSFKQSADGQHMYWLHMTPTAPVQTQLWVTGMANPSPQKLADHIHLPPPLALDETGKKFLYISNQPGHEGLYLTEMKP